MHSDSAVKEKIVMVDEDGNGIVKVGRNHLINDDKVKEIMHCHLVVFNSPLIYYNL